MKKVLFNFLPVCLGLILLSSCEEEYVPKASTEKAQVVVEAYLEKGSQLLPSYVILTKSFSFYTTLGVNEINKTFVHNAKVYVIHGLDSVEYQELCLNDLPPELKKQVAISLGYNADSIKINYCIYADLTAKIKIEEGQTYQLYVEAEGDKLTAHTTIPKLIPLDTLWFEAPFGKPNDTFAQLFCRINDIPGEKDFYRYFTASQGERLTPNVSSVTDDVFFDGQNFKFILQKARGQNEGFGDNTGLFRRGDTVTIKWCNLDSDHYEFWNTLEVSSTRQGPFASYVRIKGNITNGLGIFGGYNCAYYTLVVPPK